MHNELTPVETLQHLSGYQIEALLSKVRVRVLLNSRQSGKTTTLRAIIYKESLEQRRDILVFGVTHRSVKYNLWKVMFEGADPIFPPSLVKSINRTDMYVELINGSTIRCSGLENVDAVLGAVADLAIFDEAQSLSEDSINKIQPMLSTRNGRMVLAGTVRTRTNLLWKYYEKGQLDHPDYTPGFRSWKVTVYDSPTPNNDDNMIKFLKSSMSLSQFKAEFECDPDSGFGRVVPDFDTVLNRSEQKLNPNQPLLIGVDFNVSPFSMVIHQTKVLEEYHLNGKLKSHNEQLHAIDELYVEDTTTQKMVELIRSKYSRWVEANMVIFYPDATGRSRKTSSNSTDIAILNTAGRVVVDRSNPLQTDRINSFNALVCAADGTRRYFVHPDCKHLTESLLGLVYDKQGKMDKQSGLDHPFDSTSYCVHQLYPITRSNITQQSLNPD